MNLFRENRRMEFLASLMGFGIGILGLAFELRPQSASPPVFWAVVGLAFLAPMAIGNLQLPRFIRRGPDPALVASACRQLASSIDALWTEQRGRRVGNLGQGSGPSQEWVIETRRLYDEGLKSWALQVFDDAVSCGALAISSRPLVEAPPPTQLYKLGDLFREAADTLERM